MTCHVGTDVEYISIPNPFFKLSARWRGWLTSRPGRFNPEDDQVPTV